MTTQELKPKDKQEVEEKDQTRAGRYYVPEVDIFEDPKALRLSVEMPGVEIDDVEIELHNDTLSIDGRVSPQAYEGLTPRYTEYNVGNYRRRFSLADSWRFDADNVRATMVDGVLEIELPKTEKARSRRIPVLAH